MKQLVLKVDVDTYLGTRDGVPKLLHLFQEEEVPATFLFSLGPDHTGRALKRIFRPGFFAKVKRTKVTSHYPLKTLLYGTLLPGPDIGIKCADTLRRVRDAGFECGVHCWDHVVWQDGVMQANETWTLKHMHKAKERFTSIFGYAPLVHGAAGWQMNPTAIRALQQLGYRVASDGRAGLNHETAQAFYPLINAELIAVPQFPTTLPTLDELVGLDGLTEDNVASHILRLSEAQTQAIYTLHAELEGNALLPQMRSMIKGWKAQGFQFTTLGQLATDNPQLPYRELKWEEIPGRSGKVLTSEAHHYL